jgi:hypothetical protein
MLTCVLSLRVSTTPFQTLNTAIYSYLSPQQACHDDVIWWLRGNICHNTPSYRTQTSVVHEGIEFWPQNTHNNNTKININHVE